MAAVVEPMGEHMGVEELVEEHMVRGFGLAELSLVVERMVVGYGLAVA